MTATSKLLNATSALMTATAFVLFSVVMLSFGIVTIAEAVVVQTIKVHGNKRINAQNIRNSIDIIPGKDFGSADIDKAIKRLFAMGLFSDVAINRIGNVLIVHVAEYAVVNKIIFQGNKKIKDAILENVISLKPRESFDATKLKADEYIIRDAYSYIGRNDVIVKSKTTNMGQGRVDVIFQIFEGKRTKIDKIIFKGNKAFSDRRLRDVIATKDTNVFSWLTQGDLYTQSRLAKDEEALRRFYHNYGYADFRIVSSNAILNKESSHYIVTFAIDEGQHYKFGDIQVESTLPGINTKTMSSLLKTRTGDIYNIKKIEDSVIAMNEHIADSGYAFAKIEPIGNHNFNTRTISISYRIDEGPRAYVERIEIHGNSKTQDNVIRREFNLSEGDAFNQTMVKRAKRRLEELGFFQSITISTSPGSEPDKIVLVVDVVEKATGEFSIGGGYTTGGETPGVSVEASITEHNLLGRAQYLRIGVGIGQQDSRNYDFSFTEPYLLGYQISAGFDVFHRSYHVEDGYDVRQSGGTFRFGIPITDQLTASLGYKYIEEEYKLNLFRNPDESDEQYRERLYEKYSGAIISAYENSPWKRSSINYGLIYSSIDDMQSPRDGVFARISQEYAGIGGDANFLKTTAKAMLYKTLSEQRDLIGLLSVGSGYIHEIGNDGARVFDMFKSNSDMIRGFRFNGIGPIQCSENKDKYFLGGTTYMAGTAEVQFPMLIVPDSLGMRSAIFLDMATLYGNNYEPHDPHLEGAIVNIASTWRISTGISLMWASPFGPLRFDYAWPIKKQNGDRVQNFNFGISTRF
ncbi:MAG: outer membrane protein insertion porin family [Candidatus Tokpelaia sp. JSC188]|nr:MAG: outer membrane protein insertion porin family [Candidatus Tokpelaia sp. JSC188]